MRTASFERVYEPPIEVADVADVLLGIAEIAPDMLRQVKGFNGRKVGRLQVLVHEPGAVEVAQDKAETDYRELGRQTLGFGRAPDTPLHEQDLDYLVWLRDANRKTMRLLDAYLDHPNTQRELD